jgi:hypothetical protein
MGMPANSRTKPQSVHDLHSDRAISNLDCEIIEPVIVNVGRPILTAAGPWRCDYQIVGLGNDERVYSILAEDGIQAIELTLKMIAATLERTPEAQEAG